MKSMSQGSILGSLPVDVVNTSSSRLYYTYTTDGAKYETTASFESQKYKAGGSNDAISNDGGTLATVYEKGTKLGLEPLDYGDSSLVGLWTFDEGAGTTVWDASGNGNVGTLSSPAPTWTTGKIGSGALIFNNSNTQVQLASWTPLMINSKTISFWANPAGVQTYNVILGNGSANYYVTFSGTGNMFASYVNGSSVQIASVIAAGAVTVGAWGYYTFVFNVSGSNVIVQAYKNGQLVGTQSRSDGYGVVSAGTFFIGALFPSGDVFNGSLDDVRIYNRALSAAEIQAMFNGGK
jgi:hypothetical protein